MAVGEPPPRRFAVEFELLGKSKGCGSITIPPQGRLSTDYSLDSFLVSFFLTKSFNWLASSS